MQNLQNSRFLKAIRREEIDTTPIWIMRQAGRYLPEYRATRARAGSFMTLCQTPELACEVTLQPVKRFPLDAAIIFSDILTIPDAMGLELFFIEGEGPQFKNPVHSEKTIQALPEAPLENLSYVYEAIALTKHELNQRIPLIGFAGSPWTLAAYMLEGRSSSHFPNIFAALNQSPQILHHLLDKLAKSVAAHLNAQIAAGVEAVMIFDTWGGLLDTSHYSIFSLHYIHQVIAALDQRDQVPVILFTKNGGKWLSEMASTSCDMISLDADTSLQQARMLLPQIALQGNMNPQILLENQETIEQEVKRILTAFGPGSGHVFNLSHGITPDVPPENVAFLVDAVHAFSRSFHKR